MRALRLEARLPLPVTGLELSAAEAVVCLSEWLDSKASATRLDACELALGRFCAAADADEDYTRQVARAIWGILLSTPPTDPVALVQEIHGKMSALGRDRLETLSIKLQDATSKEGDIPREAGKLIACWFKAIALTMAAPAHKRRALHVARVFEETFVSLARLAGMREDAGTSAAEQKATA